MLLINWILPYHKHRRHQQKLTSSVNASQRVVTLLLLLLS